MIRELEAHPTSYVYIIIFGGTGTWAAMHWRQLSSHHCGGRHYICARTSPDTPPKCLGSVCTGTYSSRGECARPRSILHYFRSDTPWAVNTSELRQLHYMGGNGKSTVDYNYIPMYQSLYPYSMTWSITSCAACMASVTSSIGPVTSTISSWVSCICSNPLCSKSNSRSPTGLRYLRILLSSSSISVRTAAMPECSEAAASGSG